MTSHTLLTRAISGAHRAAALAMVGAAFLMLGMLILFWGRSPANELVVTLPVHRSCCVPLLVLAVPFLTGAAVQMASEIADIRHSQVLDVVESAAAHAKQGRLRA